jgi:hypothetical protein
MHQAEDKYKNNEGERKGSRNVWAIGYFWLKDQLSRSELLGAAPEPSDSAQLDKLEPCDRL